MELPKPRIGRDALIVDTARVVGDVELGDRANIWYGAVIRGDMTSIHIGAETSIQDNAVVHSREGSPVWIGNGVVVGHGAILHGCRVGDGALIGMGAIVLDDADIGPGAVVGAGALVAPGARIPAGMLALGSPARVVRELRPDEVEGVQEAAQRYVELSALYRPRPGMKPGIPLVLS